MRIAENYGYVISGTAERSCKNTDPLVNFENQNVRIKVWEDTGHVAPLSPQMFMMPPVSGERKSEWATALIR